ncbi:retrovirus-related pol polyprotein from transposon TNT 1-94 [Tanacetum coccineum]|uniref:Retrovirus-related pol polyprotein from transposon TNT 1-94 n=1 Tax=Tanacetum coccineum TaxID=301880 RepID=A0ABQ5FGK4_9ASTR
MSETIPPIPPPLGTNHGNVVSKWNLPQLLDSKGGSHVTNVPAFDKEDFTSWKVRFLVFLDGLEPYLIKTPEDRPFVPLSNMSTSTNPLRKPQNQWTNVEARLANQDKRLKSIIISCLPNDVMKAVIKCKTAIAMWNYLILAHEGPSDTRDTKIAAMRLKFNAFKALEGEKVNGTFTRLRYLLNDLENNDVIIPQAEINATFVNSLPRKWLSMNQTQIAWLLYVEEDLRSSSELIGDLNAEYHERALLANQKRFYKRSGRVGTARKPIDKSNEFCFACGKQGNFQKECPSNKTSTPSYPPSKKSSRPSDNHQKDYKGKYKGLKAETVDEESVSSEDEGTTKVKAFMAIAEEEPSVGKADARSGQWVEITMKKALGGRGKRKEKISSKEVIFTKADKSSSMSIPEITSESECETQDPRPPLPKLIGVEPAGTLNSLISLADLTLNMADLKLNTFVPKKTKPTSDKVSHTHAIKKKTETKPLDVLAPIPEKKAKASAKHLLQTLMEEFKSLKEHIKVPSDNSPSVSQPGSSKSSKDKQTTWNFPLAKKAHMIPKPCKDCKYCGFNDHHSDNYKYYPGCEMCGSVAHETADCPKKHPNNRKPRIANKRSTEPTEKYSKESGPKVVFGDNSLGDTEGYGSVNCNGITFTRVAYVNGLKHNLISISQLCDANFKVLFTKTQGTIFNQNDEVVLIAPRRRDVYVIHLTIKKAILKSQAGRICDEKGISQNFSSPCTPKQNGVVERRNRTLIEAAKTMLNSAKLPKQFWGEAVNTACYTQNISIIVKRHGKTTYNMFRGRSPDISYFYVFGCPVHIHNHRDHLEKFDEKANDGFFLGYSLDSVSPEEPPKLTIADDHLALSKHDHPGLANNLKLDEIRDNVINEQISEPLADITARSRIRDSEAASAYECLHVNFLSEMEPKKLIEALEEE